MEFRAKIQWTRIGESFDYKDYSRAHNISFDNGIVIQASSAVEYLGTADRVNPEEVLVASLSSCHMLTFLAIAAKSRLVVDSYIDQAFGVMTKREADGKLWVSHVTLVPKIVWGKNTEPTKERLIELHRKSHENCFIANSVKSNVEVRLD
ncbi:MAG: OsmC family protein [Bdellovibrionales bacterium]|nr:OsmC family protein [Bdellovibrionales bacterium]